MKVANFQISLNRQLLYYNFIDDESLRTFVNLHDITQEKNTVKGKFSKGATKRMKNIIDLFTTIIASHLIVNVIPVNEISKHVSFVTLTLSSPQMHDDAFIRRHMLNDFLRIIKEKYNVKSYIYCSEAQENGRIHFHILLNKYIHHKKIRGVWNNIQDRYKYLDYFYNKFKHKNPNSTDVHNLKKIKSLAAYLTKYFTKDEKRRKIKGHLWGCSDNLRELKFYEVQIDNELDNYLNYLYEEKRSLIYNQDFFSIFRLNNFNLFDTTCQKHYPKMLKFYDDQYNLI